MSNMLALQTLELVEGWKFWRWEISEVSLYINFSRSVGTFMTTPMTRTQPS